MNCPSCGATNPDTAQWCGQCLHRFGQPSAPPPVNAPAVASPGTAPTEPSQATLSGDGAFRRTGDDIEWACSACGQFNSIDVLHCSVCGTGFADQFETPAAEVPRNWSQAFALSAVAPGAGHLAIGRYGSGTARLVLFLTWILGAILLVGGGRRALIAVIPLLLGAVAVYAVTLADIRRLERGEAELLVGRNLLYLVLGVLGLLALGLITSLVAVAM